MSLISFFKKLKASKSDDKEMLRRYKRLRNTGRDLGVILTKKVPRRAITECGKKLGLLRGKALVLRKEDELSVLFDYCLFNYRRGGKNIIERYIEESPPPPESDEMILLSAMAQSSYSLFIITEIREGYGAVIQDLLRGDSLFLMDIGIGKSGRPGIQFAGRVMPMSDFYMTSGAFIPLQGERLEKRIMSIVKRFERKKRKGDDLLFSKEQESAFSAQVIRVLLRGGALNYTVYTGVNL